MHKRINLNQQQQQRQQQRQRTTAGRRVLWPGSARAAWVNDSIFDNHNIRFVSTLRPAQCSVSSVLCPLCSMCLEAAVSCPLSFCCPAKTTAQFVNSNLSSSIYKYVYTLCVCVSVYVCAIDKLIIQVFQLLGHSFWPLGLGLFKALP